ncbi:MAG: hypothetical protein ACOYA9_10185 [Bilifractor sp.]|jgi:DNA-directed RNA polymerase subunit RPC12/RpoP
MTSLKTYKCPNCGGALIFDPHSQKLRCDHCGSDFYPIDFRDKLAERSGIPIEQFDQESLLVYHCPNCGAEIITSSKNMITNCAYCGSEIALTNRLPEDFRPDIIIPFSVSREDAEFQYDRCVRHSYFAPSRFRKKVHLEKMQGMYIPVWLFTCRVRAGVNCWGPYTKKQSGYMNGVSFNIQSGTIGRFREEAEIIFERVAEDGLGQLDDRLVEVVGPFDFRRSAVFNSAYLVGFSAQRWDTSEEVIWKRVEGRIEDSAREELVTHAWQEAYSNYSLSELKEVKRTVDSRASALQLKQTSDFSCEVEDVTVERALVPIWMMYTKYAGKNYLFAVNGQTGTVAGKIPRSPIRVAAAAIASAGFPLIFILYYLDTAISNGVTAFLMLLPAIISLSLTVVEKISKEMTMRTTVKRLKDDTPLEARSYRTTLHEEK